MATFSCDVDLLKWEPILFRELASASQTLCRGDDGMVDGIDFTSASGLFVSRGIKTGNVITLCNEDHSIDGCYEVVSVESETEIQISVVRQSSDDAAIGVLESSGVCYHINTYNPQAEEIAFALAQYFGLKNELICDESGVSVYDILDPRVLRQSSVFGIMAAVFASAAIGAKDSLGYWDKSSHYQKLFESSRLKVRLEIDKNKDCIPEDVRIGGSVKLRRG